ncbi:MAG: hypothetical protein IKN17_08485 [Ruminococcus sp.]|nr:hypothetical protein [Ruminococcus sp.]
MKKYSKMIAVLGTCIVFGLALAACDGRLNSIWFSLEIISMILLTACYFFTASAAENTMQSFAAALICSAVPMLLWFIIVRNDSYLGYSGGKLFAGSLICGGIMFLCGILSRYQIGPLRAALGRNMLPAFFCVAGLVRLIKYFDHLKSFTISFNDSLCVHGLFFVIFAFGVFIGANRSLLVKLDAYIAAAIWGGVFTVLHIIEQIHIPILDL